MFRSAGDPIDTVLFTDGLKRVIQTKKDISLFTGPTSSPADVMSVSGRVIFDAMGRSIAQYYPVTESLGNRSAQAAANSRNLEKNPHYATSGGDTGGGTGGGTGGTTAPGTASNQDNFLYYYHPDHLGSSSYVTDAYGKVFQHLEYFPFRETWVEESSNTQRTPYLFTAKELDEETGLYYFGARYYDPRTSVWQSTDPVDRFTAKSPTIGLNLYHYGLLNPTRYLDPDGRLEYDPANGTFAVQPRDTLSSISKQTGSSVDELLAANPSITDRNKVFAGQQINIPETANIKAFKWAAGKIGSTDYAVAAEISGFASGTNKCNLFCSQAYESGAGTSFPRHYSFGLLKRDGPATAGELAASSLPGTTLVGAGGARIGDVVAWKRFYTDATGHSAIFTGTVDIRGQSRPPGEWGTIGAGSDTVNYRTQGYLEQHGYTNPGFRRIGQ